MFLWNNVVLFLHRDHLHTGVIKIVKVAFQFSSDLTLFPFYEVSLVFVLFLGDIIFWYQFNRVSMHLIAFCITFMGLLGCYSNQSHPDAKSLRANFLEANYLCKVTCRNEFKNDALKAQVMNFKGLSSSCCGHSVLMQFKPLY